MHIDAPKGAVTSLRDFVSKYAMFVLSIVTALAFEQAGQWWYHSRIANEAARKIDAELRANIDEIRTVNRRNADNIKKLEHLSLVMAADIKAGMAEAAILKHLQLESKGAFGLNVVTPTLRREAWDVAVANQSASHMPPETLQRYSAAYSSLRDAQQGVPIVMQITLNGPAMMNVMSDMEIGKADARDVYHVLKQMLSASGEIYASGANLGKDLEKALKPG